jgi:hypothetical protein
MLKIFEQIFRRDTTCSTHYPDDLIERAIDRSVDATDPRIRILSSYRKQIGPAVVQAIDHVTQLVSALAPPVPVSDVDWASQPILGAMFASADNMRTMIAGDRAYRDFAAASDHAGKPVTALLLAKCSQKQTYGFDLVDDKTVSDAPLTIVSFDDHRLIGLAAEAAETQRLLKLRAFDYLLGQALADITNATGRRKDLVARRRLLKAKLDIVARSSGNLAHEPSPEEWTGLQRKMNEVELALSELGADDTVLQRHLQIIVEALANAGSRLNLQDRILYLDHMHYLRAPDDSRATAVPVQILCDANAHELAAQPVALQPGIFAGG